MLYWLVVILEPIYFGAMKFSVKGFTEIYLKIVDFISHGKFKEKE